MITEWMDTLLMDEPWFKELAPRFRTLDKAELPKGVDGGTAFRSVCINPNIFLPYVLGQCLELGVTVRRGTVQHIAQAAGMHAEGTADVVVNCTGLMASKLGGVMDEKVIPARGQIVVVRNEAPTMMTISGTDDGPEQNTYIMMRPNGKPIPPPGGPAPLLFIWHKFTYPNGDITGGGTVIGGSYEKGNFEAAVDPNLTQRIMKRAIELCPELVKPGQGVEGLDVIKTYAGLRPLRIGGVRLEKEVIDGVVVVHNYGAGGFGCEFGFERLDFLYRLVISVHANFFYTDQASFGMAEHAARLVDGEAPANAKL